MGKADAHDVGRQIHNTPIVLSQVAGVRSVDSNHSMKTVLADYWRGDIRAISVTFAVPAVTFFLDVGLKACAFIAEYKLDCSSPALVIESKAP